MTATRSYAIDPAVTASLFSELQDLKRLAPAGVRHSLADDLFRRAWHDILADEDWAVVADRTCAYAVLYVLFPGVDAAFFAAADLGPGEIAQVCTSSVRRTLTNRTDAKTEQRLLAVLPGVIEELSGAGPLVQRRLEERGLPDCLERLRVQPRAGATHPEHPRLVLLPPESHADHCLMTAVYATLSAAQHGADRGIAFACSLTHHLHNAYLPDCGWAGELALEPHLERVINNCRRTALKDLPPHLRPRLENALTHHETIATPEGKAVSTGDVLDRVLDVKWRTRTAAVTDQDVLGDLDLVHPGPLKDFQTRLLAQTNLWNTP